MFLLMDSGGDILWESNKMLIFATAVAVTAVALI